MDFPTLCPRRLCGEGSKLNSKPEIRNSKQIRILKEENSQRLYLVFGYHLRFEFVCLIACFGFRYSVFGFIHPQIDTLRFFTLSCGFDKKLFSNSV